MVRPSASLSEDPRAAVHEVCHRLPQLDCLQQSVDTFAFPTRHACICTNIHAHTRMKAARVHAQPRTHPPTHVRQIHDACQHPRKMSRAATQGIQGIELGTKANSPVRNGVLCMWPSRYACLAVHRAGQKGRYGQRQLATVCAHIPGRRASILFPHLRERI